MYNVTCYGVYSRPQQLHQSHPFSEPHLDAVADHSFDACPSPKHREKQKPPSQKAKPATTITNPSIGIVSPRKRHRTLSDSPTHPNKPYLSLFTNLTPSSTSSTTSTTLTGPLSKSSENSCPAQYNVPS